MLLEKIDDELIKRIYSLGCDIRTNERLSRHTSLGIGGEVSLFISPYSGVDFEKLFCELSKEEMNIKIIGRGSNILAGDDSLNLTVMDTSNMTGIEYEGKRVTVESGYSLRKFVIDLANRGFCGLEKISGIPGSVGGAIRMNAGAYGDEIFELVETVTVYDMEKKKRYKLNKNECEPGYRKTVFCNSEQLFIENVTFILNTDNSERIKTSILEYAEKRAEKQPVDKKSAGSVFKKPDKDFHVGKVIEELGMKGYRVGDAEISSKHSGFIINRSNATCKDFKELIQIIKYRVFEKTGVMLETEIEFW